MVKPGSIGEDHWASKLTEEDVAKIREVYRTGTISQAKLAREYGVSRSTINKIIRGKLWKENW